MNRGSSPVKSTTAEAFPSSGPAFTIASSWSCKSCDSDSGLVTGVSPLRFALVDASGPVRSSRPRSHARSGTRIPIELWPGLPIAQLSFMALDAPAERPYGHPDLGSHYHGQVEATESRYEGGPARRGPER